jgi:hypothetical protein
MGFLILANLEDELTAALHQRIKHIRKDMQSFEQNDKKAFLEEIEKDDFHEMNSPWSEYLKLEALKLLDSLTPIEDRFLVEVEHYRLIPEELRDFLESNPDNMFKLGTRLKQAINAKERLAELEQVLEGFHCDDCSRREECILYRILRKKQVT